MVKIHFLNVGHGDCIIIENHYTKRNTIIDINRSMDVDKTTSEELLEAFEIYYGFNRMFVALESNIKITDPIQYLKDIIF